MKGEAVSAAETAAAEAARTPFARARRAAQPVVA